MPENSRRSRAIAILVLVNALWGISFPMMKAANGVIARAVASDGDAHSSTGVELAESQPTLTRVASASFLMTLRFAIAITLIGVAMPGLFRGMTASQWLMGGLTGLGFAAGFLLQIMALSLIPASRSAFLTSLSVVFTPILMVGLERRRPRAIVLFGAAVAIVGTTILAGALEFEPHFGLRIAPEATTKFGPGDWMTATAALIFSVQIILIDIFSRRMPPNRLTPGMFAVTLAFGVATFVGSLAIHPAAPPAAAWTGLLADVPFAVVLLTLSVFCTVLTFHWMNKYQAFVSPAHAALIYTLEPIFTAVWVMCLPALLARLCQLDYANERPTWNLVIGGSLVLAGNVTALWPGKHAASESAAPCLES